MADGGASTLYYFAVAAAAAGAVVEGENARRQELERSRILEAELRSSELLALDEENQRLIDLRFANEEILAMAGGVFAYASASLTAARKFNFRMFGEDSANAALNLATNRASTSARIRIHNANAGVFRTVGILNAVSTVAGGLSKGGLFDKPGTKLPTGGAGGANATKGIGHLDLPGANPANGMLG